MRDMVDYATYETYEDDNETFMMKLIPCFDEQERTYLMPPQTSHHMSFGH